MKKIKCSSKYTPIVQKPYGCVIACLQMVLFRRGLKLISQDKIGFELGLIVPKEFKKILPFARTGKKPLAGWGTQVQKEKYSINRFFKKYNLPLKEEYFHVSKIKNVKNWLREQLEQDRDVIVCFKYGKLYNCKGQGHVSVIDSIKGKKVILIDPGRNVPKYRKVELDKLINAANFHGKECRGGFWVIG